MNLSRIFTLLAKDIRACSKSFFFIFALLAPVVITLVVSLVFGNLVSGRPSLGIVDGGESVLAADLLAKTHIIGKAYENEADLREAVESGAAELGIVLPAGFDEAVRTGSFVEIALLMSISFSRIHTTIVRTPTQNFVR
jgi:ABC-2 type transport system permease protein